jgi:SAM-dependent methyltransferase
MLRRLKFDAWYMFRPPWDTGVSPPELHRFMDEHAPGRAIDLGCGTGTNVITLAQHGWQVTGLDFSSRAIRIATRKIKAAGLTAALSVCDVTRMSGVAGPFDLALDVGCFHGNEHKQAYLDNLRQLLAPGGNWLLYGFVREGRDDGRPGISPADLELVKSFGLQVLSRQDGTDGRSRSSAWFLIRRATP